MRSEQGPTRITCILQYVRIINTRLFCPRPRPWTSNPRKRQWMSCCHSASRLTPPFRLSLKSICDEIRGIWPSADFGRKFWRFQLGERKSWNDKSCFSDFWQLAFKIIRSSKKVRQNVKLIRLEAQIFVIYINVQYAGHTDQNKLRVDFFHLPEKSVVKIVFW